MKATKEEEAIEDELNYNQLANMRDRIALNMYDAYIVELERRGL